MGASLTGSWFPPYYFLFFNLQAISNGPKDAMLHFSLANALSLLGTHTEALVEYKKCIELDKTQAKFNIEYGRTIRVGESCDADGSW